MENIFMLIMYINFIFRRMYVISALLDIYMYLD